MMMMMMMIPGPSFPPSLNYFHGKGLGTRLDSEDANIDRILTVCAALVNLCPSVVPE